MIELSRYIAALLDYPFGWLLVLPRDLAIVLVAVGSSLLMTFVRKWTTDQNMMRRCKEDLNRIAGLKRDAKKSKDKPAMQRMQATEGMIKWKQMKAEFLGLAVSIVPIGLLATWAYERLEFLPPQVHQDLIVKAYYPLSSVDRLTHIIVTQNMDVVGSPIQTVTMDTDKTNGVAEWKLHLTSPGESELVIRHRGESVQHPMSIGKHSYAPSIVYHEVGSINVTQAVFEQPDFLGIVPGIPQIGFAPWLVAYIILAVLLVPGLRRVFRIC